MQISISGIEEERILQRKEGLVKHMGSCSGCQLSSSRHPHKANVLWGFILCHTHF